MLISFEGGEYTGKDSQIVLLNNRLLSINPEYKILSEGIREPGSTLKAEVIRMLLKNNLDTDFVFPGDFRQTFDLGKYKKDFQNEEIPAPARTYLKDVIESRGRDTKTEVLSFLLKNDYVKGTKLKGIIEELNTRTDNSATNILLGEYFRKEVLSPKEQFCLYAAARNIVYDKLIIPATGNYDVISLNRSRDSSCLSRLCTGS